jgi:hypothetical protein
VSRESPIAVVTLLAEGSAGAFLGSTALARGVSRKQLMSLRGHVPDRHGYRLVLATWEKVTRHPDDLVSELLATMRPVPVDAGTPSDRVRGVV